MMKNLKYYIVIIFSAMQFLPSGAYGSDVMLLPRQDGLPDNHVTHVVQDDEGFLWYATEGGGVCMYNGRGITVFRSDDRHPGMLGSNQVVCLEEAGNYIIIGTRHGAYVLGKPEYSVEQLADVDEKRVDDIIVSDRTGHWWLTANKKIYEYSADGRLIRTYKTPGDKYISRLYEDCNGCIWASQWEGGLLCRHSNGSFVKAKWPLKASPTAMADVPGGRMLVGTIIDGAVLYDKRSGSVTRLDDGRFTCIDMVTSGDKKRIWLSTTEGIKRYAFNEGRLQTGDIQTMTAGPGRLSVDNQGALLVASAPGQSYAIVDKAARWLDGKTMAENADSVRTVHRVGESLTAYAFRGKGVLWYSTGKEVVCATSADGSGARGKNERMAVTDVSAMTFTPDGTLWLGTIYGKIMSCRDGVVTTDEYASNEYGDAVVALTTDVKGHLLIVYDRYVRLYDYARHTLRQQCAEGNGIYCLELSETESGKRWSTVEEPYSVPWWVWGLIGVMAAVVVLLVCYVLMLRRQRQRFVNMIKHEGEDNREKSNDEENKATAETMDEFLSQAISVVEQHISEDAYSVEQLSADLCMSRMTFYRKIQAKTGQTPTEFIRTIRLRRAAEMLKKGDKTISEISYATGFSSVSYFSRSFRAMYGVSPTQFVEKI